MSSFPHSLDALTHEYRRRQSQGQKYVLRSIPALRLVLYVRIFPLLVLHPVIASSAAVRYRHRDLNWALR